MGSSTNDLYHGLRALAESSFPKHCPSCGRCYETAEQFLAETQGTNTQMSGLKAAVDDDGNIVVEVFRNCHCGSTLLDYFSDRRDMSEAGQQRRRKFEELLEYLVSRGVAKEMARAELLKVLHGEHSTLLAAANFNADDLL